MSMFDIRKYITVENSRCWEFLKRYKKLYLQQKKFLQFWHRSRPIAQAKPSKWILILQNMRTFSWAYHSISIFSSDPVRTQPSHTDILSCKWATGIATCPISHENVSPLWVFKMMTCKKGESERKEKWDEVKVECEKESQK